VYAGADGEFDLYDDAGDGCRNEKGAFGRHPVTWNDARKAPERAFSPAIPSMKFKHKPSHHREETQE
jgi:hypothetical protein